MNTMSKTPEDVIDFIREQGIKAVDLRFIDPLGKWQHFTVPASQLTVDRFESGFGFQGTSARGWGRGDPAALRVRPDANSMQIDPVMEVPTLVLLGDVLEGRSLQSSERCSRAVAVRAESYLRSTGIADSCSVGVQAQFHVLDDLRYANEPRGAFYAVDSALASWNSGREEFPNLAHKVRDGGNEGSVMPTDSHHDLRAEMALALDDLGVKIARQRMASGTGGQGQIDLCHGSLALQADGLCWLKYVVKNVARRAGKVATFMPKPIFGSDGNGLHIHLSLWKQGQPLFAAENDAGLSEIALHFVAGILAHTPAICAFTNASTNSYKRLAEGDSAPNRVAQTSGSEPWAAVQLRSHRRLPGDTRVMFRTADSSGNPYLALSAVLMAGLDGVERQLEFGAPSDLWVPESDDSPGRVAMVPDCLEDALDALAGDHEFLLKGDVFRVETIESWVDWKRNQEVADLRGRPHPYEFAMYHDV